MNRPKVERVPPQSLDAEQAVLGSVLLSGKAALALPGLLEIEDFYHPGNRKVCQVIFDLIERDVVPDLVTVPDELRRRQWFDVIGGMNYIAALPDTVPTAAHLEFYAETVKRHSKRRRLIEIGGELVTRVYDDKSTDADPDVDEIATWATGAIHHTVARRKPGMGVEGIQSVSLGLRNWMNALDDPPVPCPRTGIKELDAIVPGFQPNDLWYIAARPSMGKTALFLSLLHPLLFDPNETGSVMFFSTEMDEERISHRVVSQTSGVPNELVRTRQLDYDQLTACGLAIARIPGERFLVDFTSGISIQEIRSKSALAARQCPKEHPLKIIGIDYLQLLEDRSRSYERTNMNAKVASISKACKHLAGELGVCVVVLCQLNREIEKREDQHPRLSDLRDSGAIEQDGDVILGLYRPDQRKPKHERSNPHEAHIGVIKHRNGATGQATCLFWEPTMMFADPPPDYVDPRLFNDD